MIQLYALLKQPASEPLAERFPNAVQVGEYRLGVFVDSDIEQVTELAQSWQHFTSEAEFTAELAVLSYEQAKYMSARYAEESI